MERIIKSIMMIVGGYVCGIALGTTLYSIYLQLKHYK